MNVERILHLADIIETQPHTSAEAESGFSMQDYTHRCGTPSCIAGWANSVFEAVDLNSGEVAAVILGLDFEQESSLFYPSGYSEASKHTPAQAARTLRHLAATGEVDWSLPVEES